jgi:microcystin-dependent protein
MEKNIIILIVILFIITNCVNFGLFFNNRKNIENMANTDDTKIKELINRIYKADIQSIRNLAEISVKLQDNKGVTLPGDLTIEGKFNYLPTGSIIAFKGTAAPKGWAICDGTNSTPNLKGRFIYGYDSTKGIGSVGGAATVTLTAAQMPSHTHAMHGAGNHWHYSTDNAGAPLGAGSQFSGGGGDHRLGWQGRYRTSVGGNHAHTLNNTGGNQAHNNMPPYCVLLYIMKL